VKRFLAFVAIGSAFATVEEFLTIVVLRGDFASYVFTLLILFPVYLSLVYSSSRLIDRFVRREPGRDLAHFLIYGSVGLQMEWFLMGLAPWSNPGSNPLLMFGFQLGMFAFWATVATAPRVFLDPQARHVRRRVLRFYVPYFAAVHVLGLAVSERLRFGTIIVLIIYGYLVVAGILLSYIIDRCADQIHPAGVRELDPLP
jgi:hypothetical protein